MLKRPVLELAKRGALNLHGSLLPRFRGRAPVNWVLIEGEPETGLTLHYMDEKPDHGDIVAQRAVAIARDDTALDADAQARWRGARAAARCGPAARCGHRAAHRAGPHALDLFRRAPARGRRDRLARARRARAQPDPRRHRSVARRVHVAALAAALDLVGRDRAARRAAAARRAVLRRRAECHASRRATARSRSCAWAGRASRPRTPRAWARRERIRAGERCGAAQAMKLPS